MNRLLCANPELRRHATKVFSAPQQQRGTPTVNYHVNYTTLQLYTDGLRRAENRTAAVQECDTERRQAAVDHLIPVIERSHPADALEELRQQAGPSKFATIQRYQKQDGYTATNYGQAIPEIATYHANQRKYKPCRDPDEWQDLIHDLFANDKIEPGEMSSVVTERPLVLQVLSVAKKSGCGPDGLHFIFWSVRRLWSAGFFQALIARLANGTWMDSATTYSGERLQAIQPNVTEHHSTEELRDRASIKHSWGHGVPKGPKRIDPDGVPVHTRDRIRLVESDDCLMRYQEDMAMTATQQPIQKRFSLWVTAWAAAHIEAASLTEINHAQARTMAHAIRSLTALPDIDGAFPTVILEALWLSHSCLGAGDEFVMYHTSTYHNKTIAIVFKGRAGPAPPMHGLKQGRRWSATHMTCMVEVLGRYYHRNVERRGLTSTFVTFADDTAVTTEANAHSNAAEPIAELIRTARKLTPLNGTSFNLDGDKLQVLSPDREFTPEEKQTLQDAGYLKEPSEGTTAKQIGGIVGYGWTDSQWWILPTQRMAQSVQQWRHVASFGNSHNEFRIHDRYISTRATYVESFVSKDTRTKQKWNRERRLFVGMNGIVADDLLEVLSATFGAPAQLTHEEDRALAAQTRQFATNELRLMEHAEEAAEWPAEFRQHSLPWRLAHTAYEVSTRLELEWECLHTRSKILADAKVTRTQLRSGRGISYQDTTPTRAFAVHTDASLEKTQEEWYLTWALSFEAPDDHHVILEMRGRTEYTPLTEEGCRFYEGHLRLHSSLGEAIAVRKFMQTLRLNWDWAVTHLFEAYMCWDIVVNSDNLSGIYTARGIWVLYK